MARIEKTVFISYRRTDVFIALAVYDRLTRQGYDVFFDYSSVHSGDFEQIIISNIKARAHFIVILTPTALDRCNETGDWLRREIETAIDEKRNIVPLFFKGFSFGSPSISEKLVGKLGNISRYNGMNVHEDYFDAAMDRLHGQFLNIPLNTVLHPVSPDVQKIVENEQEAANRAVLNNKELEDTTKRKPAYRIFAFGVFLIIFLLLSIFYGKTFINIFAKSSSSLDIGSAKLSAKDGMTLLYVPEGAFKMGSQAGDNEKPIHTVVIDAFWIDRTEITNSMYAQCVQDLKCNLPSTQTYYNNPDYSNHPVVYVSWDDANTYCSWAGRRLPTEAEWEKSARGTESRTYPWGEKIECSLANYFDGDDYCVGQTSIVGSYPKGASPYGALDMAGNVLEWVSDWYDANYYNYSPPTNPQGPKSGEYRILRGGGWYFSNEYARSTYRFPYDPSRVYYYVGFRCALSASE